MSAATRKRLLTNSLFPKYKKFTADVVQYDHQNTGKQLPEIAAHARKIHRYKQNRRFQRAGPDPGSFKFGQFRYHNLCGPIETTKYKGLIGYKGKRNRRHPGDNIADAGIKPPKIAAGQVNDIIYRRSQYTENQINDGFPVSGK